MLQEGFTRYVIDIAYKGTVYHGFQIQPNANTVQEEVEKALSRILKRPIQIYSAGRTDAGVHGLQMPVQFDFEEALPDRFMQGINGMLPYDIAADNLCKALRPDFNVRFAAIGRSYVYRIARKKMPLLKDITWGYRKELDIESMKACAAILFEYDSFESFCKAGGSNKTFFCKITESRFEEKENMLEYYVSADRFLRGMVRAIIGTLLEVGKGNMDIEDFRKVIETKSRSSAGSALPAEGLTLTRVFYKPGELEKIE